MDFRNKRLSVSEAKKIDIVHFLADLGYEPSKIRNNDYWYFSPLRDEKTPSFKVNRKLNRWYDHGLGKGGNLVDFAILYHGCTVSEFLQNLSGNLSLQKPSLQQSITRPEPENQIKILGDFILSSTALLRYLQQRRIPVDIADRYCREVQYELNGKVYYGIGFKNDLGGFEIRNPYFKASSSPKGITTIDNSAGEVIVFEGFTDFLSFKATHQQDPEDRFDFVVLNSVSFFETARPFLEKHNTIRLYLDRDTTGQNCSRYALSLSSKYKDESSLYQNHKDFNDWIVNFGKPQRKHQKQKLK
ncbi:toprim domain-containing protein [Chitinophaga pendula]|uniref:toprim domain-containing protein n=1 Tax=Chitinophaga TaxID=79328 RepID=UPI000BAF257A|nr:MULTISPECIES: toprim domain-containing protein [Chitinophaga]ASZ09612.1 DNA primase [Chitinophaga sp. MD30]UCJ07454.1 toprim domain-containing protein [Chitinophaga pendula]